MYDASMSPWGSDLIKRRPDVTMDTVQKFVTKMFRTNADFVFTVTRDFVKNCQTRVRFIPKIGVFRRMKSNNVALQRCIKCMAKLSEN
jgi:hypothetical protein